MEVFSSFPLEMKNRERERKLKGRTKIVEKEREGEQTVRWKKREELEVGTRWKSFFCCWTRGEKVDVLLGSRFSAG